MPARFPTSPKERLKKTLGHINATERKLWHDTDRGLWSAKQAKARLAEAWLWLEDGAEYPPRRALSGPGSRSCALWKRSSRATDVGCGQGGVDGGGGGRTGNPGDWLSRR